MRRCGLLRRWSALLLLALGSCTRNETPSGPRLLIPPSVQFTQGEMITYQRENYTESGFRTAEFQDVAVVVAVEGERAGLGGVAAVRVATGNPGDNPASVDTAYIAFSGGGLVIYDPAAAAGGAYPALSPWTVLLDLRPQAAADTLLAFDSTFTLTMASGHLLRDRVSCSIETRYAGFEQIPAFGSPIVNCFVYTRTIRCDETVDTSGVLLFQGPVIALLDSVWFADDIGPIRMSSRGTTLAIDSLGLPFSLASLRVFHTADAHRSFEVSYSRAGGTDELALRYGLYEIPPTVHTVITAIARSY